MKLSLANTWFWRLAFISSLVNARDIPRCLSALSAAPLPSAASTDCASYINQRIQTQVDVIESLIYFTETETVSIIVSTPGQVTVTTPVTITTTAFVTSDVLTITVGVEENTTETIPLQTEFVTTTIVDPSLPTHTVTSTSYSKTKTARASTITTTVAVATSYSNSIPTAYTTSCAGSGRDNFASACSQFLSLPIPTHVTTLAWTSSIYPYPNVFTETTTVTVTPATVEVPDATSTSYLFTLTTYLSTSTDTILWHSTVFEGTTTATASTTLGPVTTQVSTVPTTTLIPTVTKTRGTTAVYPQICAPTALAKTRGAVSRSIENTFQAYGPSTNAVECCVACQDYPGCSSFVWNEQAKRCMFTYVAWSTVENVLKDSNCPAGGLHGTYNYVEDPQFHGHYPGTWSGVGRCFVGALVLDPAFYPEE